MIIYFSGGGVVGVWQRVNELLLKRGAARLLSFAYKNLLTSYCELAKATGSHVKVMVDSGAFTAWSKGTQVDLEELSSLFDHLNKSYSYYCDFVLINLDVIPGRKGVDPTEAELQAAMKQSAANFKVLNFRFPDQVLPVFHQGEPTTYYDSLINESEYVCLSPRNDIAEKHRVEWSRYYSQRSRASRYHGLAATGLNMMETVPWFSVDSAAWVMVGGYGNIFWRSAQRLNVLAISSKSRSLKEYDKHLTTLPALHRQRVTDEIQRKGYTLEALRESDIDRYMWNAEMWLDLTLNERFTPPMGVLFDG